MFDGIEPMPWLESAANWFPRTEKLQPDEMRIIFMGTSPLIRPGQANTSIFVELGNGDNFIFDLGEGSIANYVAAGFALNELTKVFITHLHVDHFGSLPYLYEFGGWNGGAGGGALVAAGAEEETGSGDGEERCGGGPEKAGGWFRSRFKRAPRLRSRCI